MKTGPWTPTEDEYVKCHYRDKPTAEMAVWLDRTVSAVIGKATRLGIKKGNKLTAHFDDRQLAIVEWYWNDPKVQLTDIAEKLDMGLGRFKMLLKKTGMTGKARTYREPVNIPKRPPPIKLTPWPDNMPKFEDYPPAYKVGQRVFISVMRERK